MINMFEENGFLAKLEKGILKKGINDGAIFLPEPFAFATSTRELHEMIKAIINLEKIQTIATSRELNDENDDEACDLSECIEELSLNVSNIEASGYKMDVRVKAIEEDIEKIKSVILQEDKLFSKLADERISTTTEWVKHTDAWKGKIDINSDKKELKTEREKELEKFCRNIVNLGNYGFYNPAGIHEFTTILRQFPEFSLLRWWDISHDKIVFDIKSFVGEVQSFMCFSEKEKLFPIVEATMKLYKQQKIKEMKDE